MPYATLRRLKISQDHSQNFQEEANPALDYATSLTS